MTAGSTDDDKRSRAGIRWIGLIIPLVILLLGAVIMLMLLPRVPDPAAVHWSGDGRPDGFAPAWMNLLPVAIGAALVILFTWLARALPRLQISRPGPAALSTQPSPTAATSRFLAAVNLGLAVMLAVISVASVGIQVGLTDAADAPDISGWAALGSAGAVVAAVVGWFGQSEYVWNMLRRATPAATQKGESDD